MANKRFIKTKSNYTLKKKVLSTNFGEIYERDYMTINPNGESNFKMVKSTSPIFQRKHSTYGIGETFNIDEKFKVSGKDSKININPNYESLKDFVFYGSAKKFINGSIKNIILNFPAEVILTDEGLVKNQYNIDFFSKEIKKEEVYNILRYFGKSWKNYYIISEQGGEENNYEIISWEPSMLIGGEMGSPNSPCGGDDDEFYCTIFAKISDDLPAKEIRLKKYFNKEKKYWVTDYENPENGEIIKIRLNKEIFEDEYNKFNTFEKILLNRESNPIFTAKFLTYSEYEGGIKSFMDFYTWPSIDNFQPDISGESYKSYVNKLYDLANFIDEHYSNNIWETMTHDSIKGMDYTFIDKSIGNKRIENKNGSRIRPILEIWGHQYDFLKRHIDNIGRTNNLTYDGKNNFPDYMLRTMLELTGFDVKQVYPSSDPNVITDPIFPEISLAGSNCLDANSRFMRTLRLNSKYILSRKGTREALRSILGLFGIGSEEYKLNEFIAIAEPKEGEDGYPEENDVTKFIEKIYVGKMSLDDSLSTFPVKKVTLIHTDENGEETTNDYLVPWFDKDNNYDGEQYFQMNGGWCQKKYKDVKNFMNKNEIIRIYESENFKLFEETSPLIKIANDVNHIGFTERGYLKKNEVMYITDITDLDEKYILKEGKEKITMDEFSNYFILENEGYDHVLGYSDFLKGYGWKNVLKKEFIPDDQGEITENAKRVLYAESLKNDSQGNNPHVGHYGYDGGKEYLDNFENLFRNTNLSWLDNEDKEEASNVGYFLKREILDRKKAWYFTDTNRNLDKKLKVTYTTPGLPDNDPWSETDNIIKDISFKNADMKKTEVEVVTPYNPERGKTYDEAAANSIINTKVFQIIFYVPLCSKDENGFRETYKKYIEEVVMFYLKQVIPSTTIFNYKFIDRIEPEIEGYGQEGKTKIMSAYLAGDLFIA